MTAETLDRLHGALSEWGPDFNVVSRLHGGANSCIFLVADESGGRFCAKLHHTEEGVGRYEREKSFYAAVAKTAKGRIPRDLRWDDRRRVALFEFVEGVSGFRPTEDDVEEAGDFVRSLQDADAGQLKPASEAALAPANHAAMLELRLRGLLSLQDREAADFVREELQPAWERLRERINPSTTAALIVSPSDFGFHNAIRRTDGRFCFFDFEHGGLDDPAKLICDMFVRPLADLEPSWSDTFCRAAGFDDAVNERARGLMDLYRLKWACIALNEFTAEGLRRRSYADADEPGRREVQLEKARGLVREVVVGLM